MNAPRRAQADPTKFNQTADLPYELRLADFELAMQDVYDLLFDVDTALLSRGLRRLEETVRPAIFTGIVSDAIAASLARHSRVLTENRYHNGHPDLIPQGKYKNDSVAAGEEGVEVKATRGEGYQGWRRRRYPRGTRWLVLCVPLRGRLEDGAGSGSPADPYLRDPPGQTRSRRFSPQPSGRARDENSQPQ